MSELHKLEVNLAVIEARLKELANECRSCIHASDISTVNRIYQTADSIYGYAGLIRNLSNTIIINRSRQ